MSNLFIIFLAFLPTVSRFFVPILGVLAYVFQKIIQFSVPVLWRLNQGKRGMNLLWPFDEELPKRSLWVIGVVTGILIAVCGIVGLSSIGIEASHIRSSLDSRVGVSPSGALTIIIVFTVLNSPLEELFFRIWLDKEASRRWGDLMGTSLSVFAYVSVHLAAIIVAVPFLSARLLSAIAIGFAFASVIWSVLMRKRGGIHAALLSHVIATGILFGWGLHWLQYF